MTSFCVELLSEFYVFSIKSLWRRSRVVYTRTLEKKRVQLTLVRQHLNDCDVTLAFSVSRQRNGGCEPDQTGNRFDAQRV